MMNRTVALFALLMVSACAGDYDSSSVPGPKGWTAYQAELAGSTTIEDLRSWWLKFNDPTLTTLIDMALEDSPDRRMAEARVMEARGLRRTATSLLFPQIGVSASKGKEDAGSGSDDFYDAGFDASFELDLFGRNRNSARAADAQLTGAQASYEDITLTLIADVIRAYIEYRAGQRQIIIAEKNLAIQEKTLVLTENLFEMGESPRLDVERAQNLVSTTRASIPEFQRLADSARLRLGVLTGNLPEDLNPILAADADIPGGTITPLLLAPAQVLALRPDIRAAQANLEANSALSSSAIAELFPAISLSGFYGISDNALISSANVWNIALGAAMTLLDFGRIEGRIDAANAREKQAYELYRKTVLQAVADVETALGDYAHINEQRYSLLQAYNSAFIALNHSQTLYEEGEISFLDVLDAQRSVNAAESALESARAAQAESLARLFKSLGVY